MSLNYLSMVVFKIGEYGDFRKICLNSHFGMLDLFYCLRV